MATNIVETSLTGQCSVFYIYIYSTVQYSAVLYMECVLAINIAETSLTGKCSV